MLVTMTEGVLLAFSGQSQGFETSCKAGDTSYSSRTMTYMTQPSKNTPPSIKVLSPVYNYLSLDPDSVLHISTKDLGKVLTYAEISRNAATTFTKGKIIGFFCLEQHQLWLTISENCITNS